MLLPEMTPGTLRALLASLAWKRKQAATNLQAEHVLLGLLEEEDARSTQLLAEQNISRNDLFQLLEIEPQQIDLDAELPVPLDSSLQKLLYQARTVAIDMTGTSEVHSEHLLLALFLDSIEITQLLAKAGFNLSQLQSSIQTIQKSDLQLEEPLQISDSQETVSLLRILDANANRAREALRVLEEACRFHFQDAFLTRLLKELRHDLTQAIQLHLPVHLLLRCRNTEQDVGTGISTLAESYRPSLLAVWSANVQRLHESLRSLEEYGKVYSPEFGRLVEQMRYQSYTLSRSVTTLQQAKERLAHVHLCLLVSKGGCVASIEWTIQEAAAGGVGMVQLREKDKNDREVLAIAKEVRAITSREKILFILNDRPDLARLSDADGVHLGQDDLDLQSARNIVGNSALIGISTHSINQCKQAIKDGADYVGIGPTFPSSTKHFEHYPGLEYVQEVAVMSTLPVFAIGGITVENVSRVVHAGVRRVAVGHSICQSDDPRQTALQIITQLKHE